MTQSVFTIDHLLRMQQPTIRVPMHVSPDGSRLAVHAQSKRRASAVGEEHGFMPDGVPVEAAGSRVLVVDTVTGEVVEPFAPGSTSWGAQWSPDGTRLAAYVQQEGPACLAVWERDSGRARLFHEAAVRPFFGFEVPQWTPDSRSLVVKLVPSHAAVEDSRQARPAREEVPRITVFTFDPMQAAGEAPAPLYDWGLCDLATVDTQTGTVHRLGRDWDLTGWRVAPDGGSVALLRLDRRDETRQQGYYNLVVVRLDGRPVRTVASAVPQSYGICFNWSPDSRQIAYTTHERGQAGRLFVAQADGSREPTDLTGEADIDLTQDYEAPRWSSDSTAIYCLASGGIWEVMADGSSRRCIGADVDREVQGWVQPFTSPTVWTRAGGSLLQIVRDSRTRNVGAAQIDLASGRGPMLAEFEQGWFGWTFGVEAALDGSAVYLLLEAADHPPEVWHLRDDFRKPRRLLSLNPDLQDVALGKSRLVEWHALDGEQRQGTLLLPPDYTEGQRVPVIANIYGGYFGSNLRHRFGGDDDIVNGHILTSRGYAILYPDLPLQDRDPQRQLPGQVLPALNRLVDLGIADPERLGLMGQSYGGYCTLALLTQTNRFKAAVSVAGAVNLTSHYGILTKDGISNWLGWSETGQGRMGGSLWEKRDAYIENSPLFYCDRISTPVLLVSGTAYPGEVAQAGEAFSALRRLGQRVELRLYEGEDHWPGYWSEGSLRDLCDRLLSWFDAYLEA